MLLIAPYPLSEIVKKTFVAQPARHSTDLLAGQLFFRGMAYLGVARLGVAQSPCSGPLPLLPLVRRSPGPLVPSGRLVLWSLVGALGRLRMLHITASGAFEELGTLQITVFVVLEMLRTLSTLKAWRIANHDVGGF